MTGLYMLFVAALWLAFVIWFSKAVTKKLPTGTWRVPVAIVVFAVVSPLPLIDEIIAKPQFEKLCHDNSEVIVDTTNTSGRTVWFGESQRKKIQLGAIQVTEVKRNYVDAKTQEPIYHYLRLEAAGGWFISHLGISEGGSPLLFNAVCQPKNLETIDAQLGLTRINRPTSN